MYITKMTKQLLFSYGDFEEYQNMEAVLFAMREKGIIAEIESLIMGEELFKHGYIKGYDEEVLRKIKRVKIFLKSPTKSPNQYDLPRELADEETAPHLHISEQQSEDEFFISQNLCGDLELEFSKTETDDYYIHTNDEIYIFEPKTNDPKSMFKVAELALEKLSEVEEEQ